MTHDQTLSALTASIFTHLDPILKEYQPDWVIVQGDTTTAMTTALAAYYHHVKVAHVEAGLRTFDKWQPFPEEVNRRIVSALADLHFAPTDWAKGNLLKEGISQSLIKVTGNTIIDTLNQVTQLAIPAEIENLLKGKNILNGCKQLITITAHRRENFGAPIRRICSALIMLAKKFEEQIEIVYPVHLNPNIQAPVTELLSGISNITLLPPLDYLPLIHLLKHTRIILTDSGGIQEEATGLGKPCLVLREVTERPEGIEAGILKLVGTDPDNIFAEVNQLLTDCAAYDRMANVSNPYGDGHAAECIVRSLAAGS
jgi:UDP-N-acetylglucosamine 2-epimerase (non-hydrolysing)